MPRPWRFLATSATLLQCISGLQIGYENVFHDDDLFSYVTMPGIKAPRFNVTINDPEKISPGYWFVAPYTSADPWSPIEDYKPHQIGPMIYDQDGELVWTGAHLFQDRSVFDFKASSIDGKPHLSFIVNYDTQNPYKKVGSAMVLDPSYQAYSEVQLPVTTFNMHEFNIVDEGKSALIITSRSTSAAYVEGQSKRKITDNGFREIDSTTGRSVFEWSALNHIDVADSQLMKPYHTSPVAWDYVHLNSVEKSKVNGDYIVSSRYTDTIYRISAEDGSIVWKFGGKESSFPVPLDMKFVAQHDARIVDEYDSTVVLSFLNNGADDARRIQPWSRGYIVALDTEAMTAQLLHTYERPDHRTTHGRGNIQVLPNRNVFANWADNAYLSEHTPDGEVVWQAQFSSKRYVTYRAYKFEFEGRPLDRPAMEVHASVTADAQLTTVFHISWNGATQVRTWNFYSCLDDICERSTRIGSSPRTGFETVYTGAGLHRTVFAEAVDADGKVLGESPISNITLSILPAMERPDSYADYTTLMPQLLVVSLVAAIVTIFWIMCQRRRRRSSLVVWHDAEKHAPMDRL